MTFAQAKAAHLSNLRARGWTVVDSLKIPHATEPTTGLRLWFKPQAVLASTGTRVGDARSLWGDSRTDSTDTMVAYARKRTAELGI